MDQGVTLRQKDMQELTLRPGKLSDAPAIAKLATQLGYPSTSEEVERRLTPVLDDSGHLVAVAETTGGIAGWIHAYVCYVLESDAYVELGGFVVDESRRGQGVGGMLLGEVEEWARRKGCGSVRVRSNIVRLGAHKFYAAQGFEQIKTQHAFRKRL